jgi:hypothetical protein
MEKGEAKDDAGDFLRNLLKKSPASSFASPFARRAG